MLSSFALLVATQVHHPKIGKMTADLVHKDRHFANKKAEQVWTALSTKMERSKNLAYTVRLGTQSQTVKLSPTTASVQSGSYSWAYTKGKVEITRGATKRSRAASRHKLPKVLQGEGIQLDPSVLTWCFQTPPFSSVVAEKQTVAWVGTTMVGKDKCDLLSSSSKYLKTMLAVRQRDHLVTKMMVQNTDAKGNLLSASERTFEYLSVR